ncbi:hypothetical protein BH23ACT9_BH23ACT9_14250 [soil metagenome]
MSATGTRPPLFDPEPGGFDGDRPDSRQQFPLRPTSGGSGSSRGRAGGSSSSSPRWVRPFMLGGLVLIAIVSLVSILAGDDGDAPAAADGDSLVIDDPAVDEPAAADPAGSGDPASAVTDDGEVTAEDDIAVAPIAPAGRPRPGGETGPPAIAAVTADPDVLEARAFAIQFTHDYLNWDDREPDRIAAREQNLRAYLAPGLDPQMGWDGEGVQIAVLTTVVEAVTRDDGVVVVTVAANITGDVLPRWVYLAVPVKRDDQDLWAVIAQPGYVPRPSAGNPAVAAVEEIDQALSASLTGAMRELFTAYAAEGAVTVPDVTAPGSDIRGLRGQVTLSSIEDVRIPSGDDDQRRGAVAVAWFDPIGGALLSQTYTVELVRSDDGWLVRAVTIG